MAENGAPRTLSDFLAIKDIQTTMGRIPMAEDDRASGTVLLFGT